MRIRKKIRHLSAMQFDGKNQDEIVKWSGIHDAADSKDYMTFCHGDFGGAAIINSGDWMINCPDNGLSIMCNKQFNKIYEEIDE